MHSKKKLLLRFQKQVDCIDRHVHSRQANTANYQHGPLSTRQHTQAEAPIGDTATAHNDPRSNRSAFDLPIQRAEDRSAPRASGLNGTMKRVASLTHDAFRSTGGQQTRDGGLQGPDRRVCRCDV